jgi:hypothetical protein
MYLWQPYQALPISHTDACFPVNAAVLSYSVLFCLINISDFSYPYFRTIPGKLSISELDPGTSFCSFQGSAQ